MLLSGEPLTVIVIAKVFAHWLTTGIPLTLISGLFALMFDLQADVALVMMSSLFIGTPVLSLVGSVGAALTLGLRGGSVLTSLLVLPLYIPVLIFGAGAAEAVAVGINSAAYFFIVGALTLFSLVVMPVATSAALRFASD
jgi:heme exporter protein B